MHLSLFINLKCPETVHNHLGFTQLNNLVHSDEHLWQLFVGGDNLAFEILFKRNYNALYQYGRKFSQDTEFVKDALQELFADLWANRHRLGLTPSVRHYLYKSLRRKMMRLQSRQPDTLPLPDEPDSFQLSLSPEQLLLREEASAAQHQQLEQWLSRLTPRQREAIYLHFYQDLAYEEVASVMAVKNHAVRNLIYEALKALRRQLLLVLVGIL